MIVAEDEASLYLQASLQRVWFPKGETPVVRAAANRDGTHFYGALNLQTGEELAMRSKLMTAEVSALFLQQVVQTYPDTPILLLWDRAPWHNGEAIRSVLAANPQLELLRFPAGSPQLNPQEHVWKAVREAVSHNHTQTKLTDLADMFETHLTTHRFPCSLLDKHNYNQLCSRFI